MVMVSIKGVLTEDGKIEVELPDGWQAGKIRVEVQIEPVYSDAELDELMQFNPKPANEIQTGGWKDLEIDEMLNFKDKPLGAIDPSLIGAGADWDIGDSAEWVEDQRSKRRRKWTE